MMQALRQLGGGVVIAIVSVILVLGGISLALAETLPAPVATLPASPTLPVFLPSPTFTLSFETATQFIVETFTGTASPSPTATALPPSVCTPPTGWVAVIVSTNDTIYSLSQRYNSTPEILSSGNCLTSINITPGMLLYVPPVAATATPIPCGPPAGWVRAHIVQPGDNLYRIALSYGITYPQLQAANCMGSSVLIYAGQRLWVPNVPTLTPVPGVTIIPEFPTDTPSATNEPPTVAPTSTTEPSATSQPSATVPAAATLTPSLTPFPSKTTSP